ncbi:MAG: hypothetical protein EHM36_15755 [Deltaproteobacteria bacterium]|nr:MAG: hypothetical protein EHM36_15755 [Deltaproteobacteria bacterium]
MSTKERVTIKIPKQLYNTLAEIIEETGFSSVTDFIVYVLRDVISMKSRGSGGQLTRDEMEQIRNKLKSLGYL